MSPAIGKAVSKGEFATNDREVPNGAGLLWAKNGARPVGVGPGPVRWKMLSFALPSYLHRSPEWSGNTEVPR